MNLFKIYLNFSKKNLIISLLSFIFNNILFNIFYLYLNSTLSAILAISINLVFNFFLYFYFNVIKLKFINFIKIFSTSILFRSFELLLFFTLTKYLLEIPTNIIYASSIILIYIFKNTFVFFLFKKDYGNI